MDLIQGYSSDEEREIDNTNSSVLPETDRRDNETEHKHVMLMKQKLTNSDCPSVDFFNLTEPGFGVSNSFEVVDEMHTKSLTIKHGNELNLVDIPNNKFWKDVPNCIEMFDSIKESASNTLSEHSYNNNSNGKTKRKYCKDATNGPKQSHNQDNNIKSYYAPCDDRPKDDCKTEYLKQKSDRKCYYVHHKISPHLLNRSSSKFKYPSKEMTKFYVHRGVINRIKWCVPMFSHLLASVSMDGTAKICNPWSSDHPCLQTIMCHSKAVKDIDWSSCGKQILTCSYDRTAANNDVEMGLPLRTFDHPGYVLCGKYHHSNPNLIITGTTDNVFCWDIRDAEKPVKTFTYKDAFGQVQDIILSRDGSQLFACTDVVSRDSPDRNVICWDFSAGVVLSNQIYQERYMCTRMKLHPVDNNLLVQSHANYIALFSANRPFKISRTKRFEGHKLGGNAIGFDVSPDGSTVISGGCDGQLYVYNYQSGRLTRTLKTGLDICMDVAIHPVLYNTVGTCSWSGHVSVWH